MTAIPSIKKAVDDIRTQVASIEAELEKALQHRETIAAMPITQKEVLNNLFYAIDTSAEKFSSSLKLIISGCARRRNGTGIYRYPEVIREEGAYHQLNVDAVNFFFGDELKAKLKRFIGEMDYPGGARWA